jgi:glycyl-tRNA synthetase
MEYNIKGTDTRFVPHVIEPSFGVDRHVLAVLCQAYKEDQVNNEKRVYLALPFNLAPIKLAVFPLLKNKPELVERAKQVYQTLKEEFSAIMWDDNGNIGKRYRRQDEIGTPYCVTIDFESLDNGTVTLRDRDSTKQVRQTVEELVAHIKTT